MSRKNTVPVSVCTDGTITRKSAERLRALTQDRTITGSTTLVEATTKALAHGYTLKATPAVSLEKRPAKKAPRKRDGYVASKIRANTALRKAEQSLIVLAELSALTDTPEPTREEETYSL